jgi:hypothetical protein
MRQAALPELLKYIEYIYSDFVAKDAQTRQAYVTVMKLAIPSAFS